MKSIEIMTTKEIATPSKIIELIKKLPESEYHLHEDEGNKCVTTEWLVGSFCGRSFDSGTYEEAAKHMIDYFHKHINHDSMVGKIVTESGFPDMDKLERFCKSQDNKQIN